MALVPSFNANVEEDPIKHPFEFEDLESEIEFEINEYDDAEYDDVNDNNIDEYDVNIIKNHVENEENYEKEFVQHFEHDKHHQQRHQWTADDVRKAKQQTNQMREEMLEKQRAVAAFMHGTKQLQQQQQALAQQVQYSKKQVKTALETNQEQNHQSDKKRTISKNNHAIEKVWQDIERKKHEAEDHTNRLTAMLDRQDEKCTELAEAFKQFKREIAKDARSGQTAGHTMKMKEIAALEEEEEEQNKRIADVRLKHIVLVNQVHAMESEMKAKEELDEGLHLIDFEQLKIENQTLNEKIEERNDEIHKLRKKTTTTVQILSHIKEKLKAVDEENQKSNGELQALIDDISLLRDRLTHVKQVRDQIRNANATLKHQQGFIGSDQLVEDFESRKADIDAMKKKVDELRTWHSKLTDLIQRANMAEHRSQHQTMKRA